MLRLILLHTFINESKFSQYLRYLMISLKTPSGVRPSALPEILIFYLCTRILSSSNLFGSLGLAMKN